MSGVLVVVLLLVCALVVASVVLGRATWKVDSSRDTEYLELEGHWIRYRVRGGGPPVVLVHGWLSSSRVWDRLADRLAQRFTVYSLDLSGFGDSDKPSSGYGIRYGSRLLYALCAHFGLTRATVVGHDVGGAMAVKLAADHPDLVGRLVLVATPAREDQVDLPTLLWLATLPVIGPIFYTLGRSLRPLRRLWMRPFVFDSYDLTDEVVDDAGKSTPAAATKTLNIMRREVARGRLLRQAEVVKVPVLVVAGEEDQIVDPQSADHWARTLPAEIVFIEGCGHLPMIERTSDFNARVLAFLTGDARYIEDVAEPLDETREEPDLGGKAPEEVSPPPTFSEPSKYGDETGPTEDQDDRPTVFRRHSGRYSPHDRGAEEHQEPSDPTAGQRRGRLAGADKGDGIEERRPRERGGGTPGLPEDLFELPEPVEFRPRELPREEDDRRRTQEERDGNPEGEPGGPEEGLRP